MQSINFWVKSPVKVNEVSEGKLIVKFPREIEFQANTPYEIKILDKQTELWENDILKETFANG